MLGTTVHSSGAILAIAVFLACAVEMVEAFTIVMAVGVTRGWRWAIEGAVCAILLLGAIVAVAGPAIVHWVPIDALRLVIGILLLAFGFQWLRKAVLRAAGRKAKHNETAIFDETVSELAADSGDTSDAPAKTGRDMVGFVVAFKGVFLEGVEVVIIVLTLGTASHNISLAAIAAGGAFLAVLALGLIVAKPLARVPENAMKMAVGIMLVSFGTFWIGEGSGLSWPGSDAALLYLVAFYAGLAWLATMILATGAARLAKARDTTRTG